MRITLTPAVLTKWLAYGPSTISKIFGSNPQEDDLWLQFFDSPIVTAGDIPVVRPFWFPSLVDTYFVDNKSYNFPSLFAAISTAQDVYAAPGAGLGLNVTIEYDSIMPVTTGVTTLVGDLTSAVADLQVWAEAAGPQRLRRLDVKNNSGVDCVPIIQASDVALTTDSTSNSFRPIADGATGSLFFGDGFSPFRKDGATLRQGCTVRLVPTNAALPFVFDAGANYNIRAIYE